MSKKRFTVSLKETRVLHSLRASLGLNQRWGNLEVGYRLRNYLDDFSFLVHRFEY